MPPTGRALTIGLNAVNAAHYSGWSGALVACENDARDMAAIARSQRFDTTVLLTERARSDHVLNAIRDAARVLRAGDVFLVTFAGHGTQIPARYSDEPDGKDETWVLYDRMLIDNELKAAFSAFAPGVSVVVVADSCTSGTSVRRRGTRSVPAAVRDQTFRRHEELYRRIQRDARMPEGRGGQDVLLLSACQDGEVAADGDRNGLFTAHLRAVWNSGRFQGGYRDFWRELDRRMPPTQNPGLLADGPNRAVLLARRPFSLTTSTTKEKTMTITQTGTADGWADVRRELALRVPLDDVPGEGPEAEPAGSIDSLAPEDHTQEEPGPDDYTPDDYTPDDYTPDDYTPDEVAGTRGGATVRVFWWGFHVELDHQTLTDVLDSADAVNSFVDSVGGSIPSPAQPWIAVIAKFVAGAHALLRGIDQGAGIYLSMSWFALGVVVPTPVPVPRGGRPGRGKRRRGRGGLLVDQVFWVNEWDHDFDTELTVEPGQRVVITADGEIWAGVWGTGTNGPRGWAGWKAGKDSPLPSAAPFSLLCRTGRYYRFVGIGDDFVYHGEPAKLLLRINDNKPGNGDGAFEVHVQVYAA